MSCEVDSNSIRCRLVGLSALSSFLLGLVRAKTASPSPSEVEKESCGGETCGGDPGGVIDTFSSISL